jgi:hypothetical protein
MSKEKPLEFVCTLGARASVGPDEGGITVKINRSRIGVTTADRTFVKKRLSVLLRAIREDEPADATQKRTVDAHLEAEGDADTGKVSLGDKDISFTLTFHTGVDLAALGKMGGREAMLFVRDVQKIPDEEDTEESAATRGGAPKRNTTGKDEAGQMGLDALCKYKLPKGLVSNVEQVLSGKRIVDLEVRMKTKPDTWMKDIRGVGGMSQQQLIEAYEAFRRDNPLPEPDLFKDTGKGDIPF